MNRRLAETMVTAAVRGALLSHLDEALALGKKAKLKRDSGQCSLFEEEEAGDHEERNLKLDAEVVARLGQIATERRDESPPWTVIRSTNTKPVDWNRWLMRERGYPP